MARLALGRRLVGDVAAVDEDRAAGGVLEAGDQPEQRGLAAAGGADEDDELAVLDVEVDVRDDVDVAEGLSTSLSSMLPMVSSPGSLYFTAPKVRPRTSCFWLNQPMIRIGAIASVEAAESFAQNRPCGLEKEAMKAVSGAASVGRSGGSSRTPRSRRE